MPRKYFLLLFFSINFLTHTFSQNRIEVNIPTALQETDYVWRTIQDIQFFEEHNYDVVLPAGAFIDSLKIKAKANKLSDTDYEDLKKYMQSHVYQKADYQKGYELIEGQKELLNKMVREIGKCKRNWHFKEYPIYQINLTLYGSGGSYDPDNGSIIIFTTREGSFKQYKNPVNTLIHEIVHIGIEASVIQALNVPHPLKERIVDKFVLLYFEKYLPEYRVQNMGDKRIDKYLKNKKDLEDLKNTVATFISDH